MTGADRCPGVYHVAFVLHFIFKIDNEKDLELCALSPTRASTFLNDSINPLQLHLYLPSYFVL